MRDVEPEGDLAKERHAPGLAAQAPVRQSADGRDVLASRDEGRGEAARRLEELAHAHLGARAAVAHHADAVAHAIHLVAVVRDVDHPAREAPQRVRELELKLPAQVTVEGGEGLVQEQELRVAREDAGHRAALLLPARELPGTSRGQLAHVQGLELAARPLAALLPAARADRRHDVLLHAHVGEEGVALEEVSHAALLGREVDARLGVEEHAVVEHDASLVGPHYSRDALEGEGLAAARGAQEGDDLVGALELEGHVQREAPQALPDVHEEGHYDHLPTTANSRSRRSMRLTARSTTAEMARFTSTQASAPASSPVRQSWYTVVETVAVEPGV